MNEQSNGELHNQDDVNPGTELDKLLNEESSEQQPLIKGTGSNNPVPTEGSVIIDENLTERLEDEPDSLGIDLDGTNPGSNEHPIDED